MINIKHRRLMLNEKNLVKIGVDMPKVVRKQFKEVCERNGTTYTRVLKNCIESYIKTNGKENIIKIIRRYDEKYLLENEIELKDKDYNGEIYTNGYNIKNGIETHRCYKAVEVYNDIIKQYEIIGFEEIR